MSAKVPDERIEPNAFDRNGATLIPIKFAAPLRLSGTAPIRCPVASTVEPAVFYKRFQQDGPVGIACLPVAGEAPANLGQNLRREIKFLDPRQDKKARVIDDKVEIFLSLFVTPPNVVVTRPDLPCTCAKAYKRDNVVIHTNEVAQLSARYELVAKVVMPLNIGVPQARVALPRDKIDTQAVEIDFWDREWSDDRGLNIGVMTVRGRLGAFRGRQDNKTIVMHLKHRHAATHVFQPAVRATPVQPLADHAG